MTTMMVTNKKDNKKHNVRYTSIASDKNRIELRVDNYHAEPPPLSPSLSPNPPISRLSWNSKDVDCLSGWRRTAAKARDISLTIHRIQKTSA